jgi:hypothetical protein
VWLEATNIHSNRPSAKLNNKRYGPFKVLETVGDQSYKLKLPETWAIHNIFHSSLLNQHSSPKFDSQKCPLPPPPEIINDEEEYEVEESMDIGNEAEELNIWYTGKAMMMSKIHGYPALPWKALKKYCPNIGRTITWISIKRNHQTTNQYSIVYWQKKNHEQHHHRSTH